MRIANQGEEEGGDEDDEFLTNLKETIGTLREEEVARIEEKRGDPPEDMEDGWPEIDPKSVSIRIPNNILYKLLQDKLKENACRNRGYILDGFPRTYDDAQYAFLQKVVKYDEDGEPMDEEDEGELEPGQKKDFSDYVKIDEIFPKSCIVLDGNDNLLTRRVRELSEEEISGTHYNANDMKRRLEAYRLANNSRVAEPSVQ